MLLVDVNILIYAYRDDSADHTLYRDWLEAMVSSPNAYAVSDLVLSGFLRVATHPRIFDPPSPLEHALSFVHSFRSQPNAAVVAPGARHWRIFTDLCTGGRVKGNLVPDAYFAALAIESGSEWITTDRDYSRFAGLRWRHPLEE